MEGGNIVVTTLLCQLALKLCNYASEAAEPGLETFSIFGTADFTSGPHSRFLLPYSARETRAFTFTAGSQSTPAERVHAKPSVGS